MSSYRSNKTQGTSRNFGQVHTSESFLLSEMVKINLNLHHVSSTLTGEALTKRRCPIKDEILLSKMNKYLEPVLEGTLIIGFGEI